MRGLRAAQEINPPSAIACRPLTRQRYNSPMRPTSGEAKTNSNGVKRRTAAGQRRTPLSALSRQRLGSEPSRLTRIAALTFTVCLTTMPATAATTPTKTAQPSAPVSGQTSAQNAARVAVARETAQVRLLQRSGGLKAVKVTGSCAGRDNVPLLKVWADAKGTPRLVQYQRLFPDNSQSFMGYYDAAGRLRYATASASGFIGLLYNVTTEYDAAGRQVAESGTRRPGWSQDLLRMPGLNPDLLKRGICTR